MAKVNKHIKHNNNLDTEVNYYSKQSLNKNKYHNFYHGTFNFTNNEIISNSQQTDITNNIIETNTQTTNYIGENCLNNNKIATVILNPTSSLNGDYLWISETNDNVAPGLDPMITYIQSANATLTSLKHAITKTDNIIQTESNHLEIHNQGDLNVNKELYYNTTHTNYTFQRDNTIHKYGNRRSFIIQNHYFTYQRKCKQELQIQLLNNIAADLQNQIDSITSGSGGSGPNEPEVGTM